MSESIILINSGERRMLTTSIFSLASFILFITKIFGPLLGGLLGKSLDVDLFPVAVTEHICYGCRYEYHKKPVITDLYTLCQLNI